MTAGRLTHDITRLSCQLCMPCLPAQPCDATRAASSLPDIAAVAHKSCTHSHTGAQCTYVVALRVCTSSAMPCHAQDREAHMHDYPALSHPHVFVLQVGGTWPAGTLPAARAWSQPACSGKHTCCSSAVLVPGTAVFRSARPLAPCRAGTRPSGRRTPTCARAATCPWTTPTSPSSSRWAGERALAMSTACLMLATGPGGVVH